MSITSKEFKIPPENPSKGIHLKNLTPSQAWPFFCITAERTRRITANLSGAMADFTESLFLNPKYADSCLDRGQIRDGVGENIPWRERIFAGGTDRSSIFGAEKNVE